MNAMSDVTEFRIDIPESELDDLRSRLRNARWPERETVDDWSQGVPPAYVKDSAITGPTTTTGAATESRLNAMLQFRLVIDGLGIHFLHVRSPHDGAMPVVIRTGGPDRSSSSSRS